MKKKRNFRMVCLGMGLCGLASCGQQADVCGTWLEPIPGMEDLSQGFRLEEGGKAESVNMATLQYEKWQQEGDVLILTGKSIGNHLVLPFSDTLKIEKLTADSLVLRRGNYRQALVREKGNGTVAAEGMQSEQSAVSVRGKLVIGHEVRTFTPEGDTKEYWVKDSSGELLEKYDALTGGVKNGVPVLAKLEVIDRGKSSDGFAAEYESVYEVVKVEEMTPLP